MWFARVSMLREEGKDKREKGKGKRERGKGKGEKGKGGQWLPSVTNHGSRRYLLLPSTGIRLIVERSTPSRQRTLIAAVSVPFGAFPVAKGAQPQVGQK